LVKSTTNKALHYAFSSSPLLPLTSQEEISSSAPILKHP
jgi:hypothetical protein